MLDTPFVRRHLDPASSMGEVLFGLIMTLTFTLGAGLMLEQEGRDGARQLLIATLGCNVAWGVIDGVLYVIGQVFDRGRLRRVGLAVRAAPTADASALVAAELDGLLEPVTSPDERADLYARIAAAVRARPPAGSTRITRADFMGALACFWLVFFATLPAAIPFVFIDDPRLALRVSNGLLLALLFWAGYTWARYTMAKPAVAGLVFLTGGVALVGLAIALGG
jgi:hypothetical protein